MNDATEQLCPRCGSMLPPGRPASMCPNCLLAIGVEGDSERGFAPTTATPPGGFEAPSTAEIAELFPQWEVIREIGRGGMGAVYCVRQKSLDRIVALKVLPKEIATDPSFAERFTREAQTLAKLNHPHIVTIHESGSNEGVYYLLMEYVDGVNLRSAMQTGSVDPQQALEIVRQICEALQYAHDHGIVHRDIKPENVLLDRDGRVKIADFGLAKLANAKADNLSLTRSHQVMGTWQYMAPEQIEQPLHVDHRADIYSLGVVFYELLTGQVPAGRFKPPSEKSTVDQRLDDVVLRALEREPDERFQQANELSGAMDRAAAPPAPHHTPQPYPEPLPMGSIPPPHKPSSFAPVAATATAPVKEDLQPYFSDDVRSTDSIPTAPFNIGAVLMGLTMAGIGAALLWFNLSSRDAPFWVGLGFCISGFSIGAGGFAKSKESHAATPHFGLLIGGALYVLIAIYFLYQESFEADLFTWIGIGLGVAGASLFRGAWALEPRLPLTSPRWDRIIMALGFVAIGAVLLLSRPIQSATAITWTGLGLYLAGSSMIKAGWSLEDDDDAQNAA